MDSEQDRQMQTELTLKGEIERENLQSAQRWVIKIGSALLTSNGHGLNEELIETLVEDMMSLLSEGKEVLLVSSGAVAAGVSKLGLAKRPETIHGLQAAAAVGQVSLVKSYETHFEKADKITAQILLTHEELSHRERYLNARRTLYSLLSMGIVPVINENDSVATDEIRFGDNDNLAALVANLVQADVLVILTNQQGIFDSDPTDNPDAKMLDNVFATDGRLNAMASGSKDGLGRGGMITKVQSAVLAAKSGVNTIIAHGLESNVITRLAQGERLGSLLLAQNDRFTARKQWLASHLQMSGELVLDDGAVNALKQNNSSLLPVGVSEVRGMFSRGDMLACVDQTGALVAKGLVNYSSQETLHIKGLSSEKIESLLGYVNEPELISKENMILE